MGLGETNLAQRLFLASVWHDDTEESYSEPSLVGLLRVLGKVVVVLFHMSSIWLLLFAKTDLQRLALVWCGLEWLFYAGCCFRAEGNKQALPRLLVSDERRHQVMREALNQTDIMEAIQGWFFPANKDMITLDQAREWAASSFYGIAPELLSEHERHEVDLWLEELQGQYQVKFAATSVPKRCMTLMFDELGHRHLPLAVYFWYDTVKLALGLMALRLGFRRMYTKSHTYWYLDGDSPAEPVFFVHGSGSDASPYFLKFLRFKKMYPGRRAILLDLPYVSITPTLTVPSMDDIIESVDAILQRHSLTTCSFGGHSYGSFVIAQVAKRRPHMVGRLLLIDPVCFVAWDPTLIRAFGFLPRNNLVQRAMHYFISLDPFMSKTSFSHPHWLENILLPQDIHCPTTVMIAEFDFLINVPLIVRYLEKAKLQFPSLDLTILNKKDFTHSSYLLNTRSLDDALQAM